MGRNLESPVECAEGLSKTDVIDCRERFELPSRSVATNPSTSATFKQRKQRFSGIKLRYVVLLIVLAWAGYHYWSVQRPELLSLESQQSALKSQIATLQQKHTLLTHQVSELNSNRFIENYAANHFNLILPGQVPFDFSH